MSLTIQCLDATLPEVRAALEEHGRAVATGNAQLIQSRSWRPVSRVRCGSGMAAVKEYRHGFWRSLLAGAGGPSRARLAVRAHSALTERGFLAAAPLALAEERRPGGAPRSFLIARWVDDGARPGEVLSTVEGAAWERLVTVLASHLAALHRQGLWIADYSGCNLRLMGWPERPEILILDYDALHVRTPRWTERLVNLYQVRRQLGESLSEAGLAFLIRTYLERLDPGSGLADRQAELLRPFLTPFRAGKLAPRCAAFWKQHRWLFPEPVAPRRLPAARPVSVSPSALQNHPDD